MFFSPSSESTTSVMTDFTAADLFAGIGGFHQAFHQNDVDVVFACEIDRFARQTYERNFSTISPLLFEEEQFAGDINLVNPATVPQFNILAAGFPCQPFSIAGRRGGFTDTRGTLFFNIANLLALKRPEAFFLENVRGLTSHDGGQTFTTIQNVIAGIGYSFHYQVMKASDYNLPQHRPRLFMVGFRNDIDDSSFEFPEPVQLTNTIGNILDGTVTKPNGDEREVGFTLRVGGRGSGVHDRRNWDSYIVDGAERRITLQEAKLMQGFPADFEFPVSETQAFKQLGNSVAVNAVSATVQQINSVLEANSVNK